MGTLSEDRVSPLLAYIQDTDIDDINMETVKLLCRVDKIKYDTDTKSDGEVEEKYELKERAWIKRANLSIFFIFIVIVINLNNWSILCTECEDTKNRTVMDKGPHALKIDTEGAQNESIFFVDQ